MQNIFLHFNTFFSSICLQKSHKISLFKILQLFYHVASKTSSIFTCNICTKIPWVIFGLFSNLLCLPDLDFTGFWAKLSKSAVTHEKHSNAHNFSFQTAKKCRVLRDFADFSIKSHFHRICGIFRKILQIRTKYSHQS